MSVGKCENSKPTCQNTIHTNTWHLTASWSNHKEFLERAHFSFHFSFSESLLVTFTRTHTETQSCPLTTHKRAQPYAYTHVRIKTHACIDTYTHTPDNCPLLHTHFTTLTTHTHINTHTKTNTHTHTHSHTQHTLFSIACQG